MKSFCLYFFILQKIIDVDVLKCPCFFDSLVSCLNDEANDAYLFLFFDLNKGIKFKFVFLESIETNHNMTIKILIDGKQEIKFYSIYLP